MSDTDSEMGWIPSIVRRARMRKRASVARTRPDHDTDEESLYETMPQKLQKMNKKKRIVRKGGLTNVTYKNISKKRRRYISDLYTTLLDSSWSYVVLLFASSFYGSWIMFGGNNANYSCLELTITPTDSDLLHHLLQPRRLLARAPEPGGLAALHLRDWRVRRDLPLLPWDAAHHRVRDQADNDHLPSRHPAHVSTGRDSLV